MTLSMPERPAQWDRTLPKPAALLSATRASFVRREPSVSQYNLNEYLARRSIASNEARREPPGCNSHQSGSAAIDQSEHVVEPHGADASQVIDPELFIRKRQASLMAEDQQSNPPSPVSTTPSDGPNRYCLCQPDQKIPRPRNAFILYRQHQQATVVAQNPGLPNPEISKIIGEQWQQLPVKAKDEWKALAEEEKARHEQQYPNYKYRPRRNGRSSDPSSISDPSIPNTAHNQCLKCGGKTMNPPKTPHTSLPYTPMTPASTYPVMGVPVVRPQYYPTSSGTYVQRPQFLQSTISPPHSARPRVNPEAYVGQPPLGSPPRNMQRVQQAGYQKIPHTPTQESPETKRRRANANGAYIAVRDPSTQQVLQYISRRTSNERPQVAHQAPPSAGPTAPPRMLYTQQPPAPPQLQPVRQHRRDPSLTLPPLKTTYPPTPAQPPPAQSQTQKSGMEAMVMSIPVINKIKLLSQVSPYLAAPGITTPPFETKGAIVAIEGRDAAQVFNMTYSLAEQLERDGKFAVRIFGGPDPYTIFETTTHMRTTTSPSYTTRDVLKLVYDWHNISQEMQEYITTRPNRPSPASVHPTQTSTVQPSPPSRPSSTIVVQPSQSSPHPPQPISAISPKTLTKTSSMHLTSPNSTHTTTYTTLPPPPPPSTPHSPPPPPPPPPPNSTNNPPSTIPSPAPIPIALVPHYQLTTSDLLAISMSITDSYSPHSHWQWLATLWRGCLGPDVTVVIKSTDTDEVEERGGRASIVAQNGGTLGQASGGQVTAGVEGRVNENAVNGAGQGQAQGASVAVQPGVEVRLAECRAVVVRTGVKLEGGFRGVVAEAGRTVRKDAPGAEEWEKAKRRVGFEVEEFLRR